MRAAKNNIARQSEVSLSPSWVSPSFSLAFARWLYLLCSFMFYRCDPDYNPWHGGGRPSPPIPTYLCPDSRKMQCDCERLLPWCIFFRWPQKGVKRGKSQKRHKVPCTLSGSSLRSPSHCPSRTWQRGEESCRLLVPTSHFGIAGIKFWMFLLQQSVDRKWTSPSSGFQMAT